MKLLSVEELQEGMVLARNIYSKDDSVIPILFEKSILSQKHISKLRENGITEAFVEGIAEPSPFFIPPHTPVIEEELRFDALDSLTDFFRLVQKGSEEQYVSTAIKAIKHVDEIVSKLITAILSDEKALVNIADIKSYDEYTFHHSLSVAVLSISIAHNLGFTGQDLMDAGRCAILHDIGKTAVPISIIQKPSKLNAKEYSAVKHHSSEGYRYLINNNIGNEDMWQGVLCHHEKYDGTGYPFGFKGNDIPAVSRIISVADVYDALTSNRPYRKPLQPHDALEYIMAGIGTEFDYDIAKSFMKKLELYSIGGFVELSNGKRAVVIANENPMRPIVKLLDTGETLDLNRDMKCMNLTIRKYLSDVDTAV